MRWLRRTNYFEADMTTVKRKAKKGHDSERPSKQKAGNPNDIQVTLDDRSKRFLYALLAIGGILVAVLAILEFTK